LAGPYGVQILQHSSFDLLSKHYHHHIQMSRTDNERYDWQDDDLETCLMMSLEESYSHSKETSPREIGMMMMFTVIHIVMMFTVNNMNMIFE
jgi:hypothetical protein